MSGPLLRRGVPVIEMGDDLLQVGLDGRAVQVTSSAAAWRQLLGRCDGRHSEVALRSSARNLGLDPDDASALIADLRDLQLISDPEGSAAPSPDQHFGAAWWAGDSATVAVVGDGPVADGIRSGLHADGIAVATESAPVPAAPLDTVRLIATHPDLVVVTTSMLAADRELAGEFVRAGIPQLYVQPGTDGAVVGPLVLPGVTACLHCLDLTRRDRQPSWPNLLTQLRRLPGRWSPIPVAWAVGTALVEIRRYLSGSTEYAPVVELDAGDYVVSLRPWARHPDCPCRHC